MHLVFYDGQCGLCDQIVQFLLKSDKHGIFSFAPLQGITANKVLNKLPKEYRSLDSLILVENYQSPNQKFFILGKGALRILWLLGGSWTILGSLSFLPAIIYDWAYRLIAKNRHRLFKQTQCVVPDPKLMGRFLP
jgi:predicted DCC family thiol-disulfide oxidoreductase YuxK